MTDYRLVMSLLLQDRSYRDIAAIAGCSHRTIAKAKKVCHDHGLTATSQVDALSAEEDAVIAESILNRIVAGAEIIALDGPNMRRHLATATP